MPPAAWKWFTSARAVRIDAREQRHDAPRGRRSRPRSSAMPAARAIATRWMVWLVEPPVAMQADDAVDDRPLVDHLRRSACTRCRAR